MKVLHIIKSLGRGGAEMLLPETLALHDQEKFEFHYIYFLPWKNQMVDAIEVQGGKVNCFEASNNLKILAKRNQVIKYIRKEKIDVVHCHLPWAGFLGRLVYKRINIPTLYTEHNKQERYHKVTKVLNKLTFNWQSKGIAVSEDVALSIEANILPKIPVQVLLNGVNTGKFLRKLESNSIKVDFKIPQEAIVVGTVAVFRFQKRLVEWLEVFSEAVKLNPHLFGVIVGDGPLKEEVYATRKRLGLEGEVLLPGLQTNTLDWFSSMDIFMMTSEFEGLPIALLEAMSCECAVVSTNAGGVGEVIRQGIDGELVGVDEWRDLPQILLKLGKDKSLLAQYKVNARKRVLEAFSLQNMVQELELEYRNILTHKP